MDNRAIGIFDSGVGGLTVLKYLAQFLPNEHYIYFGDTKNLPYGSKSESELADIVKNIMAFFKKHNVKAVIMGCNTTAATVYEKIKDDYDFVIYPIIQCACESIMKHKIDKIGVLATEATVKTKIYTTSLEKYNEHVKVFEKACPNFVQIVEKRTSQEKESIEQIKNCLEQLLEFDPEKIILGCTHYPYLMDVFAKFAPADKFINPAKYFVDFVVSDLKCKNLLSDLKTGKTDFYVTKSPEDFVSAAELFFCVDKLPIFCKLM